MSYEKDYPRRLCFILVVILLVQMLAGCANTQSSESASTDDRGAIRGVVVDKYTKRDSEGDKFYVVIEDVDGKEFVFENTDSLIHGKFRSADMQAKLKVGQWYDFDTWGYRSGVFNMFPNITEAEKIVLD